MQGCGRSTAWSRTPSRSTSSVRNTQALEACGAHCAGDNRGSGRFDRGPDLPQAPCKSAGGSPGHRSARGHRRAATTTWRLDPGTGGPVGSRRGDASSPSGSAPRRHNGSVGSKTRCALPRRRARSTGSVVAGATNVATVSFEDHPAAAVGGKRRGLSCGGEGAVPRWLTIGVAATVATMAVGARPASAQLSSAQASRARSSCSRESACSAEHDGSR